MNLQNDVSNLKGQAYESTRNDSSMKGHAYECARRCLKHEKT